MEKKRKKKLGPWHTLYRKINSRRTENLSGKCKTLKLLGKKNLENIFVRSGVRKKSLKEDMADTNHKGTD